MRRWFSLIWCARRRQDYKRPPSARLCAESVWLLGRELADSRWLALLSLNIAFLLKQQQQQITRSIKIFVNESEFLRVVLTCDLGFDLALHLQGVDEDAAVADEARAGYSSVRLAEALFIEIVAEKREYRDI